MLYFPQLSTAAMSQYPVARTSAVRTIVNALDDGGSLRMIDSGFRQTGWRLTYNDIPDSDFQAIQQLFVSVQGRLQQFTLLDPAGNLLAWSEDLTQSVWSADPMIQISGGAQDPEGGQAATAVTNTAQAAQRITQLIAAPSWYQYSFSLYVRSDQQTPVGLIQISANGQAGETYLTTAQWTRIAWSCQLAVQDEGVSFGIEVPAGETFQVFGFQVEAQPNAGGYKKTTDLSGVYPSSRFDDDTLDALSGAPGLHSCQMSIVSLVS